MEKLTITHMEQHNSLANEDTTNNKKIKTLRQVSKTNKKLTNAEIQEKYNINNFKYYVYETTKQFYQGNLRHLKILDSIHCYTKDTAPFKTRQKMPYQIFT